MSENWQIHEPRFVLDAYYKEAPISPWAGHRNFAYDLVAFRRPKSILELGTHYGVSFFAFVQAAKDLKLDTHCVAIDTWEGDADTGFYGKEVYELVRDITTKEFADVNVELKKMTFEQGLCDLPDEYFDIIHIDGLHSFAAVKQDFESSLSKLSDSGLVLFHDISDSSGYGSSDFWKEVSQQHRSLEFQHAWGLGILFPKKDDYFTAISDCNFADKQRIYEYKAKYLYSEAKLKNDLEWQSAQTTKFWQEAQQLKNDLKWHSEQAAKSWQEAQKLKNDLEWQSSQTAQFQQEAERLKRDLESQSAQTAKFREEAGKLKNDLEVRSTQTARMEQEAEKLKRDLQVQSAQTARLEQEAQRLKNDLEAQSLQTAEFRQEAQRLKDDLELQSALAAKLRQESQRLTDDMRQQAICIDRLSVELRFYKKWYWPLLALLGKKKNTE